MDILPDIKCDICNQIIDIDHETWDTLYGLTLCNEHLNQIEAIEKISFSFASILCGAIYDKKYKRK